MFKKFKQFLSKFKLREKEIPENQDALGAYPLRMQISAIPERRYLRTTRLLAVLTFLNLGVMIALTGMFIYRAVRLDVRVDSRRFLNIYTMDPAQKAIVPVEFDKTAVTTMDLVLEQAVREFITARNGAFMDKLKQKENSNKVFKYLLSDELQRQTDRELQVLTNEVQSNGINKEVHIYSLNKTPSGLWRALVDVFDRVPEDPYAPVCACDDNSRTCLACKFENNVGHHRYLIYVRSGLGGPAVMGNPFGIQVVGHYIVEKVIHPEEQFWDLPSVLRPEL